MAVVDNITIRNIKFRNGLILSFDTNSSNSYKLMEKT